MKKSLPLIVTLAISVAALFAALNHTLSSRRSWSPERKVRERVYESIESTLMGTVNKVRNHQYVSIGEIVSFIDVLQDVELHLNHPILDLRITTAELEGREAVQKCEWMRNLIQADRKSWLSRFRRLESVLQIMAGWQQYLRTDIETASRDVLQVVGSDLDKVGGFLEKVRPKDQEAQQANNLRESIREGLSALIGDPEVILQHMPTDRNIREAKERVRNAIKVRPAEYKGPDTDHLAAEGGEFRVRF